MEYFDRESKAQFRADLIDLSEGEVVVLGRRNLCSRVVLYVKTVVKKTGIVRVLDNMPMSRQCRKVAIKYGSSVLSYYQLLRMLALMNLVIFIPWLVLAVIPWFKYWEPKGYKAGATLGLGGDVAAGALTALTLDNLLNATVTGAVVPTSLIKLVNGTLAPPFVLRYKDDMVDPSDLVRNIFGLPVTDRTDTTFFFYPTYLNEFDGTKMGSWWVVLVLLTYTGSLLFVVLHIGHSLARGNLSGHVTPESRLPMSLFAWDWQVRDAQAVREKMTGCWMECLAEYYALMRSASLFEGQTVEARKGKYDPWWRCEIVTIDGVDCWVQPIASSAGGSGGGSGAGVDGEAVKFLVTDAANIKEVTTCGLSARAWRRIAGSFLSLLLCGGAVAGFYFSLFNKEDLDKDFPFTSALVVKAVNICIPFLQRLIVRYERIADPQAAIAQEVMRVFFIKMVGLVFVFISLVRLKESGEIGVGVCADYLVGTSSQRVVVAVAVRISKPVTHPTLHRSDPVAACHRGLLRRFPGHDWQSNFRCGMDCVVVSPLSSPPPPPPSSRPTQQPAVHQEEACGVCRLHRSDQRYGAPGPDVDGRAVLACGALLLLCVHGCALLPEGQADDVFVPHAV